MRETKGFPHDYLTSGLYGFIKSNISLIRSLYAGVHCEVVTPVPIPNTEVKHLSVDDTSGLPVGK